MCEVRKVREWGIGGEGIGPDDIHAIQAAAPSADPVENFTKERAMFKMKPKLIAGACSLATTVVLLAFTTQLALPGAGRFLV